MGNITVTEVSWDTFSVSWEVEGKEFDSFLVEVSDPDGLSDGQNHTLSGQEFSLTVTDLSPSTFYRITLYGIYKGDLVDPVFAEAVTGIKSWPNRVISWHLHLFVTLAAYLKQQKLTSYFI